ncbi:hypothetical protein EG327_004970 [Venturia inaequalis]|uniref:Uncharacterized protein n=1 Tax=Venturia inaequalis TaxID=5025 RepID=A0A8H3Z9T6_VENIN|nr:hypothetical protein EG327_004970 [Venturia inaequalis]
MLHANPDEHPFALYNKDTSRLSFRGCPFVMMQAENEQGSLLPKSFDEEKSIAVRRNITRPRTKEYAIVVLLTSMIWMTVSFGYGAAQMTNGFSKARSFRKLDCGNSTVEAKDLGCIFDPLAFLWVPAACYDTETTELYKETVDWSAYDAPGGTVKKPKGRKLSLEEMGMSAGKTFYWTSGIDHVYHCAYMWQRMHKMCSKGQCQQTDGNSRNLLHTQHCSNSMIKAALGDPEKQQEVGVQTLAGFSECFIRTR